MAVTDYKMSDFVFKLVTRDCAYMIWRAEIAASFKGQPFPKHFRISTVWTRQKGRWLIRFEQGTIIPEAPKP